MNLPEPKTEWSLNQYMGKIRSMMTVTPDHSVLIGAGRYHHHIPATIPNVMGRSEFLTAYTPYQPEMAQGTLQGLFEYQTLTARLLGVDVANASMYDGATGLAEALLMGLRIGRKKTRIALSAAIHPHYREVVAAYFQPTDYEIVELPFLEDGRTDLSPLGSEEVSPLLHCSHPIFSESWRIWRLPLPPYMMLELSAWPVFPNQWPLGFSRAPAVAGPISSAGRGKVSEYPFPSEVPVWECLAAARHSCAICLDVLLEKQRTSTESVAMS